MKIKGFEKISGKRVAVGKVYQLEPMPLVTGIHSLAVLEIRGDGTIGDTAFTCYLLPKVETMEWLDSLGVPRYNQPMKETDYSTMDGFVSFVIKGLMELNRVGRL